ncbi:uncharacterized protein LOC114522268 [Dendronephthya gigantea]|uniref:uncharacterized protein LOC114522268 n=1 Tax=Dendronephthya gigantea TaxID=151771 RepID=UPI00106A1103|nr:uncharacterized protein LOC114522268 [Dendronephthya gigantea]
MYQVISQSRMDDQTSTSATLSIAKQQFVSLLSSLPPAESKDFLDWIIEQHSLLRSDETMPHDSHKNCLSNAYQHCVSGEETLQAIIEDLRGRLPLSGICSSETMFKPEIGQNSDCNPATTAVIDSFLYDDDDIDLLCANNQFSRNYCRECGSHNTNPLTLISHSMSTIQMKYIFKTVLPRLSADYTNATIIDIGSRLGAVLYYAYYFSKFKRIVGIEMNTELCQIQNEVIQKYGLGNRIETVCSDVCNVGELLHQADVILLNNTFEFFLQRSVQISTWKNIRQNICKPGCLLIAVPSLEESICIGDGRQPILDLQSWVIPLNVDAGELAIDYSVDDIDELNGIHFYKVK